MKNNPVYYFLLIFLNDDRDVLYNEIERLGQLIKENEGCLNKKGKNLCNDIKNIFLNWGFIMKIIETKLYDNIEFAYINDHNKPPI